MDCCFGFQYVGILNYYVFYVKVCVVVYDCFEIMWVIYIFQCQNVIFFFGFCDLLSNRSVVVFFDQEVDVVVVFGVGGFCQFGFVYYVIGFMVGCYLVQCFFKVWCYVLNKSGVNDSFWMVLEQCLVGVFVIYVGFFCMLMMQYFWIDKVFFVDFVVIFFYWCFIVRSVGNGMLWRCIVVMKIIVFVIVMFMVVMFVIVVVVVLFVMCRVVVVVNMRFFWMIFFFFGMWVMGVFVRIIIIVDIYYFDFVVFIFQFVVY